MLGMHQLDKVAVSQPNNSKFHRGSSHLLKSSRTGYHARPATETVLSLEPLLIQNSANSINDLQSSPKW